MNRTLLILSGLAATVPAHADARDALEGVWRNRPHTLVVRIAPCGPALCGTVVEADADAQASTRRAGTPNLIGTQVLSQLRKSAKDTYKGQVYNPNLNIHAAGTVTLVSSSTLLVEGCVLGGLICRHQHWTRIG